MDGRARIREHCRWLRSIGLARERVEAWEDQLLRDYDKLATEMVAASLMGSVGYRAAAERQGVHPSTIYRRAKRHAKLSHKLHDGAKA